MQKGRFLRILAPLLKSGLPLLKNVIKPLGMLGLTAAASATNAAINTKILVSGTTSLIISNDEMKGIFQIVKSLEDSGILLKEVSETIKDEATKQKGGFLSALLSTLGASLLGDMLFSRKGKDAIRAGEGVIRAGYRSNRSSLRNFDSTTPFNKLTYYQSEPRVNGVYFRDNLSEKIKDGAYVISLDEYSDMELIGYHYM